MLGEGIEIRQLRKAFEQWQEVKGKLRAGWEDGHGERQIRSNVSVANSAGRYCASMGLARPRSFHSIHSFNQSINIDVPCHLPGPAGANIADAFPPFLGPGL